MLIRLLLVAVAVLCSARNASAIEPVGLLRESAGGSPAGAPTPCGPIGAQRNGNCGNYRWYNVCSGYLWAFNTGNICGGTQFGGALQPCVAPGNVVKRAITYWRNVVPGYNQTVDVFLDRDVTGNGCPDGIVASDPRMDPGLRWNCSNFGSVIPAGINFLIVRAAINGGTAPTLTTDGPFSETCDPVGNDHSYFYSTSDCDGCTPWRQVSPTGRGDNLLYHLIVDGPPTATQPTSWGSIKGLYR